MCGPRSKWCFLLLTSAYSLVPFFSTQWPSRYLCCILKTGGSLTLASSDPHSPHPPPFLQKTTTWQYFVFLCVHSSVICSSCSASWVPQMWLCSVQWNLCVFLAEGFHQSSPFPDVSRGVLDHLLDASLFLNRSAPSRYLFHRISASEQLIYPLKCNVSW